MEFLFLDLTHSSAEGLINNNRLKRKKRKGYRDKLEGDSMNHILND